MADPKWATSQLSRLLGLDEESAKQVVEYTSSISPEASAEHLKNMLGDSPQAFEFISSFNSRRQPVKPQPASTQDGPAPARRHQKKPKKDFNALPPPRRPDDYGSDQAAYKKKDIADDYMPSHGRSRDLPLPASASLTPTPAAVKKPTAATGTRASKPPPSAAGTLISDLPNVRSRTASPNPKAKTKVTVAGGTPMHGGSTVLNDLDSAIRSLELQTNPATANADPAARACDCLATKHPLLNVAPNCLACGKVICAKEGLGPCTFCSTPILSQSQIQDIIRELRDERGRERQNVHNVGQRKAEVATAPRPFQAPKSIPPGDASLAAAQAHRDKLLGYQAHNAQRTRVHDEAADFETPSSGTNMWSSPVERAQQLKRQQKILREMEWAAKPEYEKKRTVVSVDLVGGKVVKRYGTVQEKPKFDEPVLEDTTPNSGGVTRPSGPGAFGQNPLVGGLIKPIWKPSEDDPDSNVKGKSKESEEPAIRTKSNWRRVQDDQNDNEEWILDGGTYGGRGLEVHLGTEEPACG